MTNIKNVAGLIVSYNAFFVFLGAVLGLITAPVIPIGNENYIYVPVPLSVFMLIITIVYLIVISVLAGKQTGIYVGAAAGLARALILITALWLLPAEETSPLLIAAYMLVSVLFVFIGYLPGRTKEKGKVIKFLHRKNFIKTTPRPKGRRLCRRHEGKTLFRKKVFFLTFSQKLEALKGWASDSWHKIAKQFCA